MENLLPTEFDVVIVGTGMIESIVSAAASRIGKTVLNIDNNNYYGGMWASFNLDAIQNFNSKCENFKQLDENHKNIIKEDETLVELDFNSHNITNFTYKWNVDDIIDDENIEFKTQSDILKDSRKFNIDLTPKLQFARGDLVELLISSNIARYSEYRNVSRVLTWLNGQLETVPCSRSDVFANSKVSVIEKRMLMKLLTSLDDTKEELKNYEHKTFQTYLKDKKLSPNLIHYVLYAISMSTAETSCVQGVNNTKRFLYSLGRFGKTPFLFSMYGSGEISQAFCRLSAVFGGICALNQTITGFVTENNTFKSLICNKQRINAKYLVIGAEKCGNILKSPQKFISRAIFITNRSILPTEKEHLTLLLHPIENGKELVIVLEMGTLSGTCPKNLHLVHMITQQVECPENDFKECIENLFTFKQDENTKKPLILWSCYYTIPDSNDLDLQEDVPENVFICPGPDCDIDYDTAVKKAKNIFTTMYPDQEFLQRAPDPEDIIFETEENNTDTEKLENEAR